MTEKSVEETPPPCFACGTDAAARLEEMFVGMVQAPRIALGQRPAERAVFRKLHGVAHGRLEMDKDRAEALKVGVFARESLPAWMRFSSDTLPSAADLGSTLGIGLKLWGVDGVNALGETGTVADFIMQNFPVFFLDDAPTMCEFTYAGVVLKDYDPYLAQHPKTRDLLDRMAAVVADSALTTQYWAILPFAFGPDNYARYTLQPEPPPASAPVVNVPTDDADYLASDMASRLAGQEYRFRFLVQVVPRAANLPLDQATEEWPTDIYPYQPVGTLVLPRQDIRTLGQAEYGQQLAMNIWRTPVEQTPQGSLAAARKVVYGAGADLRHQANGEPQQQPVEPRAASPPPAADHCIVKAVIHPAIGVARVGNAPHGHVVGPEVTDPLPRPVHDGPGQSAYRDAEGRLYPQAARFRIYGCNAKGEILRELTAPGSKADIRWTTHLANRKAAWYEFQLALDIPEAAAAEPSALRNPTVADRATLVLDAGPHTIHAAHGEQHQKMVAGKFLHQGDPVYLGRMWCEKDDARLLVAGGRGKAASADGSIAITFANNDGWHDDVSDGPVTASVVLDGVALPVTPAWLVVAPPDYGPQAKSVRTMWDLMRDVAVTAGTLPRPAIPSFTHDIYPIFERLSRLQWMNAGFAAGFGWKSAHDFSQADWAARLNDRSLANQEMRRVLKNAFRHASVDSWSPAPWPWVYGDAMNIPTPETPRAFTQLTGLQLAMLDQWVAGDFADDWDKQLPVYRDIEAVPLAEQGDMLTRAALDYCLADAFHPGCEMTWPVRAASLYMAPFRFRHAPSGWVEPGMGAILTAGNVGTLDGPLYGQVPGGITRWMAVPWQTDTARCRSGYETTYDPYVPTFWPARVPNQVLTRENYAVVMDAGQTEAARLAAFANRAAWNAPLGAGTYVDQINKMIEGFDHLGMVEVRPGPVDAAGRALFPATIQVEDRHVPVPDGKAAAALRGVPAGTPTPGAAAKPMTDLSTIDKVRRFPHGLRR